MNNQFLHTIKNKITEAVKLPSVWILFSCILLCLLVYPIGILGSQTITSDAYTSGMKPNIEFSKNTVVMGEFVPAMDGLKEMAFRFLTKGNAPDGKVKFEICNTSLDVLQETVLESGALRNYHDTVIPITCTLLKDTSYLYRISATEYDDEQLFLYSGTIAIGPTETGICTISDQYDSKEVPGILYTYHTRCTPSGVPAWFACIAVIGLLACAAFHKNEKAKFVPFVLVLFLGIFLIQLRDESTKPLIIHAGDMNVISGYSDDMAIGLTPDSEFDGTFLKSGNYLLDAGEYRLGVSYRTNNDGNYISIFENGKQLDKFALVSGESYLEETFLLEESCQDFTFSAEYDGESEILIDSFTLIPETDFYKDTTFLTWVWIISLLAVGAICLYMEYHDVSSKGRLIFAGLIFIGALASLPYIKTGLNWAVDLCYHLVRIEGIKDALDAGQFPVILYPKALHENGYLNVMYPSLFLHIPAYLRLLGVSMADSFKFLMILFHLATAFITFHCVYSIKEDTKAAFLASAVYTLCPYRFTNLYARGAIGEFMAMTFFPLIFAGLYHILVGNKHRWRLLTVGMIGLLGCHILSALFATIFCFIICIIYVVRLGNRMRWFSLLLAATTTILLSLGFLVPFLDFYKSDSLWMQALDFGDYYATSLNLGGLLGISLKGDYYGLTLGLPIVLLGVLSVLMVITKQNEDDKRVFAYCKFLTILGLALTFMVLAFFPGEAFEALPGWSFLLSKSQFAWRLLGPISLLFAITGSIALFSGESLKKYAPAVMVCLLVLSALSATRFIDEDYAYAGEQYTKGHEEKLIGIPKTDKTVVYPFEWRPLYTADSDLRTEAVSSDEMLVTIQDYSKENYTATVTYSCKAKEQFIELPILCYAGYKAYDENNTPIATSRGHNGRIRFDAISDNATHTVTVSYEMPKSYIVFTWISILTGVTMTGLFIFQQIKKQLEEN